MLSTLTFYEALERTKKGGWLNEFGLIEKWFQGLYLTWKIVDKEVRAAAMVVDDHTWMLKLVLGLFWVWKPCKLSIMALLKVEDESYPFLCVYCLELLSKKEKT